MRYLLLFRWAFAAAAASAALHAQAVVSADDPRIVYEGRCAVLPTHDVELGFPGITLHVRADAARVRVHIRASSDDVMFDVAVDGGTARRERLTKGDNWLTAYVGPAGVHEIAVLRRTESWQGTCAIEGLDVDGQLLQAAALPARKLMFIGDSITCGAGADPENSADLRNAARSSAGESFGVQLAHRLHAQYQLVSYGGRGLVRDWQGIRDTNNAPQFYDRVLPDDTKSRWDPASYRADGVVVCLGTNDFNQGIPDENEFVNTFVEFIRKIQRDSPAAQVFLMDSPMLVDEPQRMPKRSVSRAYLDEVVRRVGSDHVRHVTIAHEPGGPDNSHPIAAQHRHIAQELQPVVQAALRW